MTEITYNLLASEEGENKVMPLEEAVTRYVRPGMVIHFAGDPSASLRRILRQFWGTKPQFTLVSGMITGPYAAGLMKYGMVRKAISSVMVGAYSPATYPAGLAHTIRPEQSVESENWSLHTIEQRLMAGALGVGFMPTRSLLETDMARENETSFKVMADPFNDEVKIGVVKALNPDISLIHGCVADRYGNTIVSVPYGGTTWGPRASRDGVLVTVEKIVSTDFIRQHPSLVRIPGYLVNSVSLVPLGAHPYGMVNPEAKAIEGYEVDYEFLEDYARAASDEGAFDAWIDEWVLRCATQEEYLAKLGGDRIAFLRTKALGSAPESSLAASISSEAYTPNEMMLIAAAREIRDKVAQNGYRTILSGAGSMGVASWMAYYWLRNEGYGLDLLWGLGRVGYVPLPGQSDPLSVSHSFHCKVMTDTPEVYGVAVGGSNARCLAVLGALQIDRFGNINNSRVGGMSIGAGGAADAVTANETVVIVRHSKDRLVKEVDYVTCPGERIRTVISSMGVFKRIGDEKEFTLVAYFPNLKPPTTGEKVAAIKEKCAWEPKVAPDLREIPPPTADELTFLRLFNLRKQGE